MSSRILFSPIHGASLLELMPIAQKLISDGLFEPIFFIFRDIPERHIQLLRDNAIKLIRVETRRKTTKSVVSKIQSNNLAEIEKTKTLPFRKRLVTFLLAWDCFSFLFYFIKFKRMIAYLRKMLVLEDITAVLVIGDRHIGWETALIKVANENDLPTLIVPFAISDPESDIQSRLRKVNARQYLANTLFGRFFSRFFPDWVRESKEGPIFFYPIGEALAAQFLGIMPNLPWSIGGGAAKRMAVESTHALESYQREGVPLEKMVVTGKPSFDHIYSRMQSLDESKLRAELGLDRDQFVILCSVPQLAEHELLSWEKHWEEIAFLVDSLSQESGVALILSLHPQSDPKAYRSIAEKFGAIIANQRIYELIPICNLLVATYSSVVVQAIGCGKPAVVVDFYGLDFSFYDGEPGVVVIKDRDVLIPTVHRLIYDQDFYQNLVYEQLQRSSSWVLFDGGCTQRVIDLLYQMIER